MFIARSQIFAPLFEQLAGALREWSEDADHDPITSSQLGLMFVDWTDPLKAVYVFTSHIRAMADVWVSAH